MLPTRLIFDTDFNCKTTAKLYNINTSYRNCIFVFLSAGLGDHPARRAAVHRKPESSIPEV